MEQECVSEPWYNWLREDQTLCCIGEESIELAWVHQPPWLHQSNRTIGWFTLAHWVADWKGGGISTIHSKECYVLYGMVKPMAITFGKAPMSLFGRARWYTQHNGQQQAYSTTLKGADRFIHSFKILSSTDTLWSLLWVADHHWKIISYDVIKKMT